MPRAVVAAARSLAWVPVPVGTRGALASSCLLAFPARSSQGTRSAVNLAAMDLIIYSSNTGPIYKSFHPISFYLIWMFTCQSKLFN